MFADNGLDYNPLNLKELTYNNRKKMEYSYYIDFIAKTY